MGYELRAHTADVAIAAEGPTLRAAFAATANGLAAAACESWPDTGERIDLTIEAEGLEALLFDYLDELIYIRDVEAVLPVDNRVEELDEDDASWHLEGSTRGVPLEELSAREIKAITYSDMRIVETDAGWRTYVVVDV
ncbi:MAG: archease [Natrialbaceae archaeon]|nr:archease [Natrialbaceae archaeon]